MGRYILRRLLTAIPTLFAISLIIFTILALAPGDPLSDLALNPAVPPEVQQKIREDLGLEDPIPVRYVKWLTSSTFGQFGLFGYEPLTSFRTRAPVMDQVIERLPRTLWISGTAVLLGIMIAIPVGVLSAVKQYSIFDQVATTLTFFGFSIPTFFTGLLLILIFSINLGWLPFIFRSTLEQDTWSPAWLWAMIKQSIMPIFVLALFQGATLTRYVRASMLENVHLDYVRTARAKGLREQTVIYKHVLRNALIPVVTIVALQLPGVITGAVITEQIFRVPGLGRLLIESIINNDTPVVMTLTFMFSILVVVFNLIADVLYGVLDPRIKYG
jgi:peptide/nickel transport system permease protein